MTAKRWIALVIFVILFVIYSVFQAVVSFEDTLANDTSWREDIYRKGGPEQLALLEIQGTIMEQETNDLMQRPTYNHRLFLEQVEHAFQDERIHGILLRINTPGGGVIESDEIYHHIQTLKEEHDKPVVVYMANMATSGGYYVSAAADTIIANRSALTGSIGVIMTRYNVQELADNLGIREESFTSGPYKDMMSMMKEMDADEQRIVQGVVDESYANFVQVVAEGRDMDREQVEELADGRIYTGAQAKELGLVDEVGYVEDAIQATAEASGIENPTVIEYTEHGLPRLGKFLGTWSLPGSEWMLKRRQVEQIPHYYSVHDPHLSPLLYIFQW